MKLLLTMNLPYFPAHGGANKANRFLAEGFAARGHEVSVVAPALGVPSRISFDGLVESLADANIEHAPTPDAIIFWLNGVEVHAVRDPSRIRGYLIERLRSEQPDWAVVSSEEPTQNLLNAAIESYPGRVVYLAHTPTFLPFGPQSFYPSERRTALLEQTNGMIAVSRFMDRYIREHSRLEPSVLYLPVYGPGPFPDLSGFDNPYVTMVNPCALKGISIFLGLARAMPEVAFAAVPTWGTTPEDMEALAAQPNVTVLEAQSNIESIFAQTRVLLMPSLWQECFGLTVVEAMLRGIPVISSDVGGLPEAKLGTEYVVPVRPIERYTRVLDANTIPIPDVPEQDIGPWREALQTLLSDQDSYRRASEAARDAALRFHAAVTIDPWEQYLIELKPGGKPVRTALDTPSMPTKPDALASLSPEQRALLLQTLKKKVTPPVH